MKYKIGDIIRRNDIEADIYDDAERVVITGWENGCYVFGNGDIKHEFAKIDTASWLYKDGNVLKETLTRL